MDGDEVGLLEQLAQRDQRDVEKLCALNRDDRVVSDDVHLQPVRPLGYLRADVAQADDAQRLAPNLNADEPGACPFAAPYRRVGLGHPTSESKQQRHRVLRRGDDVAARRIDDEDAFPGCRGDVDVVHADPRPPNHAQLSSGLDDGRGHTRFAPHHQSVEVGNLPDQLSLGQLADHSDLAGLAQAFEAVLRQGVGD